jgi:hypothetical protein
MLATNEARLVRTRLRAQIQQAGAKQSVAPDGKARLLPGQGGVVPGIGLGSPARGTAGDHVEPGVSLGHPEPAAYHAIRLFSCVGNPVTMLDGPAAGAKGLVFGKHGPVLAMFSPADTAKMAPGEWAVIEAQGVGLACEMAPDLNCHSCSPQLLTKLAAVTAEGRLKMDVAAILPSIAAAAGIGMPASMFNMDLNSASPPVAALARDLRFGDIVAVRDQDHRYGRRHRLGWTMIGVISHGETVGGGHGFGLMTLLTAPSDRFELTQNSTANLARLLPLPWSAS